MINEILFKRHIERLGHRPACTTICVPKMIRDYESGKREFDFFVNPHNLCWYMTDSFKVNVAYPIDYEKDVFTLTVRDFKFGELGII